MYVTTPSGIDEDAFAIAILSGLAGSGLLCARTKPALDLILEAGSLTDYRDGINPSFAEAIKDGSIRCDARWSKGPDEGLVSLVKTMEGPDADH